MTGTWPKSGVETDPIAGPAVTAEAARAAAAEALKQDASTAATDAEVAAVAAGLIPLTQKGAASGVASLGTDSLLTPAQRPQTYGTLANRPTAGTAGDKALYFASDDNGGTLYQVQSAAWVKVAASAVQSGGAELGYAETTATQFSSTTYPTRTDVASLSITVTVGTRPIKVIFDCAALQNNSTGGAVVSLMEGATEFSYVASSAAAAVSIPAHREVRLTPSAGSHTYKIALSRLTAAGTVTLIASATPAFIQVVEC